MLPAVLAKQLKRGLCDYIETTFPMTNPYFKGSIQKMLSTEGSVFHDAYVSVRLPFRVAEEESAKFEAVHPKFKPYLHQHKAYERLIGEDGRSTIIATGTGSGKTECFQYPILEYCYKHRGEPGIKALIVYPMNALATDQAKRIAELIYNSPELKGKVTAGMYVGGRDEHPSRMMTENKVITDKDTMRMTPPDILLTNYKMLDYLLVRPKDAELWRDNEPDTLKYIAVDELHTFDGAQGTDLACLLRRLKSRLYTQHGYLCCIGTSATMGSDSSTDSIKAYAQSIFGEDFEADSVITEDRLSAQEFFEGFEPKDFTVPDKSVTEILMKAIEKNEMNEYLKVAVEAWFEDAEYEEIMSDEARLDLTSRLMHHDFTQSLIKLMEGNYYSLEWLQQEMSSIYPTLKDISNIDVLLDALISLISHARNGVAGKVRPFLTVSVQLWMRELRRVLAKVSMDEIDYALAADLNEDQAQHYLPVINCRDCGQTGWVGILDPRNNIKMTDLKAFYNLFFSRDEKVKMLFPITDYHALPRMSNARLCPECMHIELGDGARSDCTTCGNETIPVLIPDNPVEGRGENRHYECPFCGSEHGLTLVGLRSTTAISAEASQLYSSRFNDDKKLLAFSDNVQDAAHRAGFFNSRTWKFGLRRSIQKFALEEGAGLSITDFQKNFIEYWHDQMSDEEFVSYFIPPNMTWRISYENMIKNGRLEQNQAARNLVINIENRIKYEIMLEYGLNSKTGRTLEKSGCSVLGFNSKTIKAVSEAVRLRTVNELGALSEEPKESFEKMVMGFLHLMRQNGAFNDRIYSSFVKEKGKRYLLANHRIKWMPGSHSGRNIPRFPYITVNGSATIWGFDSLNGNTKYAAWIEGCRNSALARQDLTNDIIMLMIQELLKTDVVVEMESPNGFKVYALNKSKVYISSNVKRITCGLCGINTFVSGENSEFMEAARCIRSECSGQMHVTEDDALDYYGRLYSNGDMVRIRAKEHTGLLKRNDREALENEFKGNDSKDIPWKSNLLSCTPTLEMGIDIGDLSTIVLCSVPPTQAQFLQRAGRAGRHDGNSLAVVVANTKPHDLYFYVEPMEMIQGVVEPPKVFLRASAVLERQFVAYCMDSWVRKGVDERAIPKRVGVCLNRLQERSIDVYPFNFLNFVQNNLPSLIRTFIQLFQKSDDGLDEASIADLNLFAKGKGINDSPMHLKVLEAFEALNMQRNSIKENVEELKKLKNEKENMPSDTTYEQEIKDIRTEIVGLKNVIRNINNKNVFNFLSDEGLLPNYAFPEAGIQLKAVLYRKEEVGEANEKKKRKYQKMVFEYNRSASTALSEFAPTNSFYVDGKKLNINKIDLSTAKRAKWRLCPNCSHAEEVSHMNDGVACPKCGSLAWADQGQVRTMLRVKMVYSNMPYNEVSINDDSDDRKTVFYCKQMLVDVDEKNNVQKAYQMNNDEFPFGYEFVKKATLREINFGESDVTGERLTIAGTDDVRKGFKVCKYCGAIIGNTKKEDEKHSFTCRARNGNLNNELYEECMFLYREFDTEALRILVPATTFSLTEQRKESFVAAFMLGMKEFFGNVDHLRATMSEEPIPDADARKQYLVIYDTVPGGTGYLKQLVQNDHAMIEVLQKALNVLENCPCKDDKSKDGCYHCLYAYRQSYSIGQISRNEAIKVLKQILEGKDNIESIEKLSQIPTNSLFESELEKKFISALESMKYKGESINISKTMVNGKEGYSLMVGDAVWEIEPQVLLDEGLDVSVKSRADFVIWPKKNTGTAKPVVIFTDGFQFHKDKVADDTLKREAIRRSGQFRLWILSWKDVQSVFKALGEYATPTLKPFEYPYGQEMYQKLLDNENVNGLDLAKNSQMELLLNYLVGEEAESVFKTHSKAIAFSLLEPAKMESRLAYEKWESVVRNIVEDIQNETFGYQFMETLFGEWSPGNHREILKMYSAVDIREAQEEILPVPKVITVLDDKEEARTDKYEADWNGFWQFFNIMQFSPDFLAICTNGIEQLTYSLLPIENQKVGTDSLRVDGLSEEWKDIFDFELEGESLEMANKLMDLNSIIPTEIGYELVDEDNEVIAEAEMAWEEQRIAFLISEQDSYRKAFADNGWKVFLADESIPDEILKEVAHNE